MVLLVVNILSSVHYMQEAIGELGKLTRELGNSSMAAPGMIKERVSLIFSRLHPPGM